MRCTVGAVVLMVCGCGPSDPAVDAGWAVPGVESSCVYRDPLDGLGPKTAMTCGECPLRACIDDPLRDIGTCCGPDLCWTDDGCADGERCYQTQPDGAGVCVLQPRDCCLCLIRAGCLFDDNAAPPLGTDYLDDPGNSIERCVADFDSLPDGEQVFVGYSDECRYDEGLCDGCWL